MSCISASMPNFASEGYSTTTRIETKNAARGRESLRGPQKDIPLQQGLKLTDVSRWSTWRTPQKDIPLQQGLKQVNTIEDEPEEETSEGYSTTTRIETLYSRASKRP